MIVVTALIKAKEGKGDELEQVIKGFVPQFLADEGCVEYRLHRRLDDPNVFFFYENTPPMRRLNVMEPAPLLRRWGSRCVPTWRVAQRLTCTEKYKRSSHFLSG